MIVVNYLALILVLIGALNWGLMGICGFNLVLWLCFRMSLIARIIYILVFISAIWLIIASCLNGGILLTAALFA